MNGRKMRSASDDRAPVLEALRTAATNAGIVDTAFVRYCNGAMIWIDDDGRVQGAAAAVEDLRARCPGLFPESTHFLIGD